MLYGVRFRLWALPIFHSLIADASQECVGYRMFMWKAEFIQGVVLISCKSSSQIQDSVLSGLGEAWAAVSPSLGFASDSNWGIYAVAAQTCRHSCIALITFTFDTKEGSKFGRINMECFRNLCIVFTRFCMEIYLQYFLSFPSLVGAQHMGVVFISAHFVSNSELNYVTGRPY